MKLSLGRNHKFLCPSSWDLTGINTSSDVQISVKTAPLTLMEEQFKERINGQHTLTAIIPSSFGKRTNLQANLLIYL